MISQRKSLLERGEERIMPDKHCRYLGSRAENSAFDRSF